MSILVIKTGRDNRTISHFGKSGKGNKHEALQREISQMTFFSFLLPVKTGEKKAFIPQTYTVSLNSFL